MAIHREELTAEQEAEREASERSAVALRQDMADPAFVAMVHARVERLAANPRPPTMTPEEFLEQSAVPEE